MCMSLMKPFGFELTVLMVSASRISPALPNSEDAVENRYLHPDTWSIALFIVSYFG